MNENNTQAEHSFQAGPEVSICLPTFNGEKYISAAIESALSQSFEDFELVVCDDQSTDATISIIESYAKTDSRIKLYKNESRLGLFANYNRCINTSNGRLIKLFAQDDLLEPEILTRMVGIASTHPSVTLIGCEKHLLTEGTISQESVTFFHESGLHKGTDVARHLLVSFRNLVGEPTTVMFRRDSLLGEFDTTFHHLGDTDLWIKLLNHGDFYHIHERLCTFRQHPDAATSRNVKGLLIGPDLLRLGEKYESLLELFGMSREEYRRRAIQCLVSFQKSLIDKGLTWEEVKSINESLGMTAETISMLEVAYFSLLYSNDLQQSVLEQSRQTEIQLKALNEQLTSVVQSETWKITQPLRDVRQMVGNFFTSSK